MKIIIDAFGGDNSPSAVVDGVFNALDKKTGFSVILVGNETILAPLINRRNDLTQRIEILDAKETISNNDSPVEAIRTKKDSSIVVGLKKLNLDIETDVFISAGSTGAVLAGAVLLLKRIGNVIRPALVPVLPTANNGSVVLIDCGANSECKPEMLLQFAKMGSAYASSILAINKPRIGLLSNGSEEKKGTELIRESHTLMQHEKTINFIGNAEGRDILSGEFDVIVADGFSGNIALKSCEGTALMMFSLIRSGIESGGLRAKLGYLLLKPVLKKLKNSADYNNRGGAILLGLKKLVIKAHGSCKSDAFCATILQAVSVIEQKVLEKIESALTLPIDN